MIFTVENLRFSDFEIGREECIEKIKRGVNSFDKLDVAHKIPAGVNVSLSSYLLTFFHSWMDNDGNVFLPDQIDPEKVADYVARSQTPHISHEMLFALVCRKQQKTLNDLYKRMNHDDGIMITTTIDVIEKFSKKKLEKLQKKYIELYRQRKSESPKLIRSVQKR